MKYIHKDGTPVNEHHCVMPDHYTQTFTIQLRSMLPIPHSVLVNLLQQKYEVVECQEADGTCVVR